MQHSNPAPDSSIRLTWTVIFCLYFAGADNQRIYWISRDWSVDTSVLLSYAQKDERCLFKALHWPVPGLAIVFFFYLKMNLQLLEREGLQFPENVPVMADFEVLAQFGCCKILSDRLQCARSGKTCSQLTKCEAVPFTSIK